MINILILLTLLFMWIAIAAYLIHLIKPSLCMKYYKRYKTLLKYAEELEKDKNTQLTLHMKERETLEKQLKKLGETISAQESVIADQRRAITRLDKTLDELMQMKHTEFYA